MQTLLLLAALGMPNLVLVDKDCRMLTGQSAVTAEAVELGKDEKPFRCEAIAGGKATCLSSRSGKTSEFLIERDDKELLILRYLGKGEWTAVIRVDVKTGKFQVASSRPVEGKGLTAELCVGQATFK